MSTEAAIAFLRQSGAVALSDIFRAVAGLPGIPIDQITFPADGDVLDTIGILRAETVEQSDLTTARAVFLLAAELELAIPGLNGLALVLGSAEEGGTEITLEIDLAPEYFAVRIAGRLALRVARNILSPVTMGASGWEEVPNQYSEIRLDGTLRMDGDGDVSIESADPFDLSPSMIAGTGVVIEAEDVTPILSSKTAVPAGAPPEVVPGWRGVFMRRAAVHIPEGISVPVEDFAFENCYLGSGGFTGEVLTIWTSNPPTGDIFGMAFSLTRIHLAFRQNALTQSAISGAINLPFFDEPVNVEISIDIGGNFTVSLASDDGLYTLTKPGILSLELTGMGFEISDGGFVVSLSGSLKLLYGGIDWPEVEVRELSIDKDGNIRIDGGWLDLPKAKAVDFNGFIMELTKIGFGKSGDRNWVGFSGSIRLVEELAFGASVEGLKILWDSSGNVDIQMSSIRVELEIPEALSFDGFVSYFQEGDTKGFKGDIALTINALKTSFDASLLVGRNRQTPRYNFFYIFVEVNLPAGIPLAQTNLAIYGFSALMGNNAAPNKAATDEWFDWYLAPDVGTTDVRKWADSRGSQALGAGITLGTAADDGYAFSAKTLLVLLLPGPLLLIDGKANMLKDRSELSDDTQQGDYQALAILDQRAGTFLINLQPTYRWDPPTGSVIDITGPCEAFFDFNRPDAWHVYLGEAEPIEKRIRAKILKGLIKADSYLMLDQAGMKLGACAGVEEEYKFGPLSVDLRAMIDGKAQVSWRPIQLDGILNYKALAKLRAFGFSSAISVDAMLEVQTPNPFHVFGQFRVKLKTPWPLPDPSARIRLEWGSPDGEHPREPTVAGVAAEHLKVNDAWDLSQTPEVGIPVIPLDAKILISFSRPVADRALIGSNGAPVPRAERVGSLEMLHELLSIDLQLENGTGFAAVERRTHGDGDLFGMWLPLPAEEGAAGKLQLWGTSPFTYGRRSGRTYDDWFLDRHPAYPCVSPEPAERACVDFRDRKAGSLPPLFISGDLIFEFLFTRPAFSPKLIDRDGRRALVIKYRDAAVPLRITPAEPVSEVMLSLAPAGAPVRLSAYRDGVVIASQETDASDVVELVVKGEGIEYAELDIRRPTRARVVEVFQVCFVRQADQDRADEIGLVIAQLANELRSETARWCGEGHVLQPNSFYKLTITTQVRRWQDGQEISPLPAMDETAYFRTAGPPGFFETSGPLRDLAVYVNSSASTPQNGAQPVYRGYDMRIVFNENYVERLFDGTGHPLSVRLRDRNASPAADERGVPVEIQARWLRDPYAAQTEPVERWIAVLRKAAVQGAGCEPEVESCVPQPSCLEARLVERPLAPRELIEARVMAPERDEPLSCLSFTTSRFVTFVHHMHSFLDAAWDHHRLLKDPANPLLTTEESERLNVVVAGRVATSGYNPGLEAPLFEELATLFKFGARPFPDRFEITALRDAQRGYGLLLESSEPIEWARVSLRVSLRAGAPIGPAPAGRVKIINASLARIGTDCNSEWVELLLQSDTSLSGFAIELFGGTPEAPAFATHYRFSEEPIMAAGSIVRVHSGVSPATPAPELESVQRYITPAGAAASWRLNPAGETIRLIDVAGQEVHRWSATPPTDFEQLSVALVRSADQTRAFIFFPESAGNSAGDLPQGRMRLEWRFARDIGATGPLLSRWGNTEAEETAIEFDLPAQLP